MEEYKRLSRELVAHGAIIDYYQDTMQIPNGNIAKWDFIKHKGAAAVVPIDEQGRLIMVRLRALYAGNSCRRSADPGGAYQGCGSQGAF